ncbi:ImmA/IrrE family metallo-endopeptidase [Paenibacillus turicensis]|uniref:ImmA/IrrE family metallo-endopeptidase n=1 Tax=Paenibacillus turicensis TaxID=160487 RepID=UPI003D28CDF2
MKAKFFYTASTINNVALEEYIAYRADDRDSRKKTKMETIYIDFVHFFLNQLEGYLDLPLNKVLYLRNEILNMIHINNEHHIKQADRLKLIEEIAYHARQKLEIAGIYILEKNMGMDIDAYSLWTNNDRAYIVLGNKKKSAVRRNFDLAHELGHLLLHYKVDMNSLSNEEHRQVEPLDLKIPIVKPGKIRSLFEILLENKLININSFLEQHHLDIQFLCKLFDIEPTFFNAFSQSKTSYFDKNAVLPFNTKLSRLKS